MKNIGNIIGEIFIGILILAIAFTIIGHSVMWGVLKVGLPHDIELKITYDSKSSSGVTVYGSSYKYTQDKFGNNLIIVDNVYEASFCHWTNTAKQKSFYGDLVRVEFYNDPYYKGVK